jgi:hypothetical protein
MRSPKGNSIRGDGQRLTDTLFSSSGLRSGRNPKERPTPIATTRPFQRGHF